MDHCFGHVPRVPVRDHGHDEHAAPVAHHAPDTASEEHEWQEFHSLAYSEYSDEFTRIYNGLETKWSKNGRLMMRNGDSGPYKFVKRAA